MATYLYETTDPQKPVRRFEIQQSMKDDAFTHHPETGEPIQRVITGGYGFAMAGQAATTIAPRGRPGGHSCGRGCGCA